MKALGRIHHLPDLPGVVVHVTSDGIVTVKHDLQPPPTSDPELPQGEKLTRIVAHLLRLITRPGDVQPGAKALDFYVPATATDGTPLPPAFFRPRGASNVHYALARRGMKEDQEFARQFGEDAFRRAEHRLAYAIAQSLSTSGLGSSVPSALSEGEAWREIERMLVMESETVDPSVEHAPPGALWLDLLGVEILKNVGSQGSEYATKLYKGAESRAEEWRRQEPLPGNPRDSSKLWVAWNNPTSKPTPVTFANFLARALWFDEVREPWRIDEERRAEAEERDARAIAPALPIGARYALSNVSGPVVITDHDRALRVHGAETGLFAAEQLAPGLDLDVFRTMARHLHTVPARRTIYWLSQVAWRVYVEGGLAKGDGWAAALTPGGNTIEITVIGGQRQLGKLAGAKNSDQRRLVFRTLNTLRGIDVYLDTSRVRGPTSLVKDVLEYKSAPGRKARIQIDLSFLWSVGATHELQGASRLLVPVLDVPPMLGLHETYHGRVAAWEERALVHLTQQSRELAKRGGVPMPWKEFADERNVPADVAERVLRAWTDTDRWRRTHAGYRLGESDEEVERAHRLLVDGGERREKSAARGRKTSDKKKQR